MSGDQARGILFAVLFGLVFYLVLGLIVRALLT